MAIMFIVLPFLITLTVTGLLVRFAGHLGIMDIPTKRSSHTVATPRGGGLGFVVSTCFALIALGMIEWIPKNIMIGLVGGGVLIAAVGWMDDRQAVSVRVRLVIHVLSAIWFVLWFNQIGGWQVGNWFLNLGLLNMPLAVLGIVAAINFYNFMDGLDGLAGTQAVLTVFGAAGLLLMAGGFSIAFACLVLGVAVLGFLWWNRPPARIFMGDVGSGFLGFYLACTALWSETASPLPLVSWVMLLSVFLVDAGATLARRLLRGERWWESHRTHVYQLATTAGYSHRQVVYSVAILYLPLWISVFVGQHYPVWIPYLAGLIFAGLGCIWWRLQRVWLSAPRSHLILGQEEVPSNTENFGPYE